VYSTILVLLIVTRFEFVPIFTTLAGNATGGIIVELDTSWITVPGTCGLTDALASIIYTEQYISICGMSFPATAAKNILRSQSPDVKNGWLVNDEIKPAFTPATTVVPAARLIV
jgi:hypothetical protein